LTIADAKVNALNWCKMPAKYCTLAVQKMYQIISCAEDFLGAGAAPEVKNETVEVAAFDGCT
jgi:hypothetical protein